MAATGEIHVTVDIVGRSDLFRDSTDLWAAAVMPEHRANAARICSGLLIQHSQCTHQQGCTNCAFNTETS